MIVDAHVWTMDEVRERAGSKTNAKKRKRGMAGRRPPKSGREWMRLAADRLIWRRAMKLAEVLSDKALEGDLPSVKLLVELAESGDRQAEPAKKRSGRTAASGIGDRLWVNGVWQGAVGDEDLGTEVLWD